MAQGLQGLTQKTENFRQGGMAQYCSVCIWTNCFGPTRIRKSGYGCHVGHISYAVFGFADDVKLLSPTIRGLQKLLEICETFAPEYRPLM